MKLNTPFARRSLLNRKKQDPNRFIFTGKVTTDALSAQLFTYNEDYLSTEVEVDITQLDRLDSSGKVHWLNIYGLSETERIADLCSKQGIHSLAIQDVLDVHQRPKFQAYDNFSFLTLKSLLPENESEFTEQISFVFNTHFLISFQEKKADLFDHVRFRIRESTGVIRSKTPDYLAYTMLEAILDNYFKTLDKIENQIEELELFNTQKDPSPEVLVRIESLKKRTHFIKKSVLPLKEFTLVVERGKTQYIAKKNIKYFLEIKDLCNSLTDQCEMINASLESATNLFFSVQGHRMNQVMKILTIVSTIFIPLTFVAGVYGMNFVNIPELEWEYGYLMVWLINLGIVVGMMFYFKRKKWF